MTSKKVFISYSHDSEEHRARVLALSERLRTDGIETILDQYLNGSPLQGWPRWMLDQIDAADAVLVVCTENYYRKFRGHEESDKGKGGDFEGALITQEIYDSKSRTLKFVPIFLSEANSAWIPEPLRMGTHYALTSEGAYQDLYDFLLEQAGAEPLPVGSIKFKPRRRGTPLSFDEPAKAAPASLSSKTEEVPGELKCCLLIREAVAAARQGAAGGGPSTTLHRLLDVALRWRREGAELLTQFDRVLDSALAASLNEACSETLPLLIAEARRELPPPGDGDSNRGDNEVFEKVRDSVHYLEERLDRALEANPAFVKLAKSDQKWPILGFRDEAEYLDFLYPSVQTVARNPDPMQHDLFERLLAQPKFSPRQLHDEGYSESLVMDTMNALLKEKWAKWTDLSQLGSKAEGTITTVGQRMLRQLLAKSDSPTVTPLPAVNTLRGSEPLDIWREKLDFLMSQEAVVSDPGQKFTLKKQIAEVEAKIRELEH